jgi:hypothetical protein
MEVEYSSQLESWLGKDEPIQESHADDCSRDIPLSKHVRYSLHCSGQTGMLVGENVVSTVGTKDPAPLRPDGLVDGTSEGASDPSSCRI